MSHRSDPGWWRVRTAAVLVACLPLLALVVELPAPRSDITPSLVVLVAAWILALGLWRRRRWAWWLGLVFSALWLLGLASTTMITSRLAGYAEAPDVAAELQPFNELLALQAVLTLILGTLLLAPATRRHFFRPAADSSPPWTT